MQPKSPDPPRRPTSIIGAFSAEQKLSALLLLMVAFVYLQTLSFEFINIDDNVYVTENVEVQKGLNPETVQWAFTTTDYAKFWQPLVWLSLMLDVEFYGQWAGGFHLTNVILHAINLILLLYWLRRLTGQLDGSFFVAAFFAVHPLHVESVAWITERKDVLSTFFGLVSLSTWLQYLKTRKLRWFSSAWIAMGCSLMSKQMLVTLPFVFLLLDYWPMSRIQGTDASETLRVRCRRVGQLILEKLPFFGLTALFCSIAFSAQSNAGVTKLMVDLTLLDRINNALLSYIIYLQETFLPTGLSVFYPHPGSNVSAGEIWFSMLFLIGITVGVYRQRHYRPSLIVGWLWFLGCLVPVIGIVQIGYQGYADRFMYFPLIGLAFGFAFSIQKKKALFRGIAISGLICCCGLSFNQVRHWKNSVTLCEHGLNVTEDNWFLDATLGAAMMTSPWNVAPERLVNQSHLQLAEKHLRKAILHQPNFSPAHFNLGLTLSDRGQLSPATESFPRALTLRPDYSNARYFLCKNLERLGDFQELAEQRRLLSEMK